MREETHWLSNDKRYRLSINGSRVVSSRGQHYYYRTYSVRNFSAPSVFLNREGMNTNNKYMGHERHIYRITYVLFSIYREELRPMEGYRANRVRHSSQYQRTKHSHHTFFSLKHPASLQILDDHGLSAQNFSHSLSWSWGSSESAVFHIHDDLVVYYMHGHPRNIRRWERGEKLAFVTIGVYEHCACASTVDLEVESARKPTPLPQEHINKK